MAAAVQAAGTGDARAPAETLVPTPKPIALIPVPRPDKEGAAADTGTAQGGPLNLAIAKSAAPAMSPVPVAKPDHAEIAPPITAALTDEPAVAATAAALEHAKAARVDDARAAARASGDPLVEAAIEWVVLKDGGDPVTFADVHAFLDAHPDWPARNRIISNAEHALLSHGTDTEAIAWYEAQKPRSGAAWKRLVDAYLAVGRHGDAATAARKGWIRANFNEKAETEFLTLYGGLLTADHHYDRADRLLWDGRTTEAARTIAMLPQEAQAIMRARMALTKRSKDAESLFAGVDPALLRSDLGLAYARVKYLRRADRDREAMDVLKRIELSFRGPYAARWWREQEILARVAIKNGDAALAYALVAPHGLTSGKLFADAEWMTGWLELRFIDDPARAAARFRALYEAVSTPISRARAAYWTGAAYEALLGYNPDHQVMRDDLRSAKVWYIAASQHASTYYGQLAAVKLGRLRQALQTGAPVTAAELARFAQAHERAQVAVLFAGAGRGDLAADFLFSLARDTRSDREQSVVAALARSLGLERLEVMLGKIAARNGVVDLHALYPITGFPDPMIGRDRPELALLHALVRQESAFDAGAVSPAGARGLMQLMPGTAKHVARSLRLRYSKRRLTLDPVYNMRLGQAHLQTLIEQYDGSYVLALAAYNAGPGRVRDWIATYGDPRDADVDTVDWIETMPFEETRNYVQRILEAVQVYRARLQGGDMQIALREDLSRGKTAGCTAVC